MLNTLEDIPFCETFYPTWSEFQNFYEYLEKITKIVKMGIYKVVPPKGWKARKDDYKNLDFTVPHPIEQIITGKDGFYELFLMQRESRSLSKYRKLVEPFDKITDNKKPEEIEKLFWRTLKFSAPLYGADAPGTVFDKGVPWNLSEIDSLLKRGLTSDIMGVTTPYLYIGSWKTIFAWHKEDLDLPSINYLHFGKPKFWYGLKQEDEKRFTEFAAKYFSEAAKECPEFMRHKTYLINPAILIENGFSVSKCIQQPGEFVVTKSAGYHAGFNMGFNCAEAVNFALKNWIDWGSRAGICKCISDAVKIDMGVYAENLEASTKKGKETKKVNHFIKRQAKRAELETGKGTKTTKTVEVKTKQMKKSGPKATSSLITLKKKKIKNSDESIDNWLCCDKCNKWRKIPKSTSLEKFKNGFSCNFIKNLNCDSAEENWRTKYTTLRRRNLIEKNVTKKELKKYFKTMKESIKA